MQLSDRSILVLSAIFFAIAFFLDIITPLGVPLSALYFLPIALSSLSPRPKIHYYFAMLATVLTALAVSVKSGPADYTVLGHPITLVILWTFAFVIDTSKRNMKEVVRHANEMEVIMDVVPAAIWVANDPECKVITGNHTGDIFYEAGENENVSAGPSTGEEWDTTRRFFRDGKELRPDELPMQVAASKGIEVRDSELTVLLPSGRHLVMLGNAIPLRDERGKVRGSVASFIDITDRKNAEEALRNERDRLASLLNNMVDEVWFADTEGNVVLVNDAVRQKFSSALTGRDKIENVASRCEIYRHDGTKRPLEEAPPLRALKGERVVGQIEAVRMPTDGELRYRQVNAIPVQDESGKIIGSVSVVRDITDLKRGEEELQRTADELRRSNEELQQFAYIASHDLREPLRMVSSYLGLLERKYKGKQLDEDAEKYIRFAVDGSIRMEQMINDLLTYSRIDTKGKPFAPIDMNDVLAEVVKNLSVAISESGVIIEHGDLPTLFADDAQMVQLMQNLVDNAIKYQDGKPPRIDINAEPKEIVWLFSVRDNGIGIPENLRDKLFQMFQRLHTQEEYPGTGIGLAIAKKIVEHHDGRIWVESKVGEGSTFFFTIPIR